MSVDPSEKKTEPKVEGEGAEPSPQPEAGDSEARAGAEPAEQAEHGDEPRSVADWLAIPLEERILLLPHAGGEDFELLPRDLHARKKPDQRSDAAGHALSRFLRHEDNVRSDGFMRVEHMNHLAVRERRLHAPIHRRGCRDGHLLR